MQPKYPNQIRQIRKEKKISGTRLAEKLGISPQYFYDLEKGKRRLNDTLIRKLAQELGVSADRILGSEATNVPPERAEAPNSREYEEAAKKIDAAVADDEELLAFWNELKQRPDLQLLCRQVRHLSPKSIRLIIGLVKSIEEEEEEEANENP